MEKIVYKTDEGIIKLVSPTSDKQIKIVDKNIPAIVEPAKVEEGKLIPARVVKKAIYEFHMETVKGIDLAILSVPANIEYKIIEDTDIPSDYSEFKGFEGLQSALNYDLTLDVGRAKEIKKAKLRYDREPLFDANDIVMRDAMRDNDTIKIESSKAEQTRLKDITLLVDPCKTIAAIKKVSV